jgi:hypothetical protein
VATGEASRSGCRASPTAGRATTPPMRAMASRRLRRRANAGRASAATATRWAAPSSPSGTPAAAAATVANQPKARPVGAWRTGASSGTAPASGPATSPHTMTAPAAGPARRLAGSPTRGIPSKTATSSGATAIWAARVTAAGVRNQAGPGSRRSRRGPSTTMPAVARTDRPNPTEWTRSGSTSSKAVTARARPRPPRTGRPAVVAATATAAMAVARRTDGSKRVRRAKAPSTAKVAAKRTPSRRRRSAGPATASTNATFWPETARRWLRPEARKSSVVAGDCARSSPRRIPVSRAVRSAPRLPAPPTIARRRPFAARLNGSPAPTSPAWSTSRRAPTWRTRRSGRSRTATTRPESSTVSPASAPARRSAVTGSATTASSRWPPRRTWTCSPSGSRSGSDTSVARAHSTLCGADGASPDQAR